MYTVRYRYVLQSSGCVLGKAVCIAALKVHVRESLKSIPTLWACFLNPSHLAAHLELQLCGLVVHIIVE